MVNTGRRALSVFTAEADPETQGIASEVVGCDNISLETSVPYSECFSFLKVICGIVLIINKMKTFL